MNWSEIEFEELYAVPSKNGLTRPARIRGSGYKMINMGELFANDRIGDIDMELVPMNDKELLTMLVEPGDLLFARQSLVLAGAGKCSLVKKADEPTTFESHIIRVRLMREIADPAFFHYYFKSPICRIRSIVTQGVQAGIRGNDLKKLKVHIPPISDQTRIASTLSAYDDLIENNRRRIQLLEQAARLLYREWFVHLRFPGHEHVTITDGVPEGWEKKLLGECFGTVLGGTPSRKNPAYWDGDVPWINSGEVNKMRILSATEFITEKGLSKSAAKLMHAGTTVLAITGATLGQVSRLEIECSANQSVIGIYDKDNLQNEWLYLFFVYEIRRIINHATGGAQQHINKEIVKATEFLQPNQQLLMAFREEVVPIFAQVRNVELQNIALAKARDLLLPRLMNGEVAV